MTTEEIIKAITIIQRERKLNVREACVLVVQRAEIEARLIPKGLVRVNDLNWQVCQEEHPPILHREVICPLCEEIVLRGETDL